MMMKLRKIEGTDIYEFEIFRRTVEKYNRAVSQSVCTRHTGKTFCAARKGQSHPLAQKKI